MLRGKLRPTWAFVCSITLTGVGCAPEAKPTPDENEPIMLAPAETATRPGEMRIEPLLPPPVTLDTFITSSLEIDQLDMTTGSLNPADANLVLGNDVDSASVQFPTGGPSTWVDWTQLGATTTLLNNHRLPDTAPGKDPSAFPMNNECVGPANVLTKMDLTYIAAANNNRYAYFAVQRAGNNGDAGYYWIFTKLAPTLGTGEAPCAATQQRLTYDISVGDILLGGHFSNNGTPLLSVYTARVAATHVDAKSAIDFTNTALWQLNAGGVAAVAVNQTLTQPGTFGSDGVSALTGGNLQAEIFAEAAVNLSLFTGGASSCGAKYYGSVITRSSGSGGTTPDLKDLAGPAIFNFAGVAANPTVTTGCDTSVHIDAHAARPNGDPIANVSCSWTLDSGVTPVSTNCIDDITVPAGSHTLHVTVTDNDTNCSTTSASAQFATATGVTAQATLTPQCGHHFGFSGSGNGSGNLSYSWTFSGPGSVSPASSTSQSGTVDTGSAGTYGAHLVVTDGRGCSASDDQTTVVADDLSATLSLQADCNKSFTYSANVSGGSGSPTYAWSFTPPAGESVNPSTLTGSGGSATVSAAGSYGVNLTVTDARGCHANPSGSVHPYAPLSLGLTASAPSSCNSSAVTFNAQLTGGSGSGTYSWTGASCGNVASCPYDNAALCASQPVSVSFTDPICGSAGPASLTYTKVTTVTVQ
jgi:hypothetical protein